jgi:hypothetical protein
MKHVSLDREDDQVKKFIRSLVRDSESSILELDGKPVVRVLPISKQSVDRKKLKAAILRRREESRRLNKDWEAVDREVWDRLPPSEG